MNRLAFRSNKGSKYRAAAVIVGITVNVLLAYVSSFFGLPVYLDTIGTMASAAVGGLFPGIITAIITNTLCAVFNGDFIYFGAVNVLLAIYTAWFVRERSFHSFRDLVHFVVIAGLISGGVSALIQWGLFGKPQNESVEALMNTVSSKWKAPGFIVFLCINVLLNAFDKGVSFAAAKLIIHFVPREVRTLIRNSGWRQRPLSADEIRKMDSMSGDSRLPLSRRMLVMLLFVSITITVIIGWAGIRLYFRNDKKEKKMIAMKSAKFAAEMIDADRLDNYVIDGTAASGYSDTKEWLSKIRENSEGVEHMFVFQVRENGLYYIFDVDSDDETPDKLAGVRMYDESLDPYRAQLLSGEEIEPVEYKGIYSWSVTAYYPVKDAYGNCRGYVGAEIELSYMADYMSDFMFRVFLIIAGFLVMILAYALWTTGLYIVYPINSIAEGVGEFIAAGTDQEKLDDAVRGLRAINVRTGDEVEKLYHAICDMASNQTEQMRSIRRFSENTVKMQDGLIVTMADLVENRDSDTGAHVQKTSAYVRIIVEGLKRKGYYPEKLTPKFMSDVVRSAPLHDVGKINIPDSVLNKPGKLTDEEYEIIKTHTTSGRKIMEKAISTVEGENYLKEARNMAAYHHERWDGKGYPEGLHGEVIPLAARIMAVADVFDALASERVYKPAFPLEKALAIIQEGAGTQFDPKCVEVFIESLPEVKAVLQKYSHYEQGAER